MPSTVDVIDANGATQTLTVPGDISADGGMATMGAKANARSTATDATAVTLMQVLKQISYMVQNPASVVVTNAGTFAVQAAVTGASGAFASGAFASGSLASGSIADGAVVTLGTKADNKSTATDTTAITIMSILKQLSFLGQNPVSRAVTNAGTFAVQAAITAASGALASGSIADGAVVTLGAKADAKSTATDTTSITIMQVLKQVSASIQAAAASLAGTLTTTATCNGGVASGSADSGNPVKVGLVAQSTAAAATTAANRLNFIGDLLGRLIIVPFAPSGDTFTANPAAITTTTATSVQAAAGAGIRNYVTNFTITNSHATVGTLVQLTDGSGGSVLWQGYAASAGGGASVNLGVPLKTTANTALYAACGTTGSNIYVSAQGYKAP